jgi:telomerase reverse transcriptase
MLQGYQRSRGQNSRLPGLEMTYPNTTLRIFYATEWSTLLSRVGDDIFHHLLLKVHLFLPLVRSNFLQITGKLLNTLVSSKNRKIVPTVRLTTLTLNAYVPGTHPGSPPPFESQRPDSEKKKKARLPSWIRKKKPTASSEPPVVPPAKAKLATAAQPSFLSTHLDRREMLYSTAFYRKSGFPHKYLLHQLPVSNAGARKLIWVIFEQRNPTKPVPKSPNIPPRLRSLVSIMKTVLNRFQKCPFGTLLARTCPYSPDQVPTATPHIPGNTQSTAPAEVYQALLQQYTSYSAVIRFLVVVLKFVFPKALWGSKENWKSLQKKISLLVERRFFEKMTVRDLIDGVKLKQVNWLVLTGSHGGPSDFQARQLLYARLLHWLFEAFLLPLIELHFYVTETAPYKHKLFYYRKPVWSALTRLEWKRLRERFFTPMETAAAEALLAKRTFGFSYLRLLPKSTGMRPILNLGRRPDAWEVAAKLGSTWSINTLLVNAFFILKSEGSPEDFGASVFSKGDIYRRVASFLRAWRSYKLTYPESKLWVVSTDIKQSFDNINQLKLSGITDRLLKHEDYILLKYIQMLPENGFIKVRYERFATTPGELEPFPDFAAAQAARKPSKSVFVDQVNLRSLERWQVVKDLEQHLFGNVVKHEGHYYLQHTGIPQGSKLSTMLCSLHYGHLEKSELRRFASSIDFSPRDVSEGSSTTKRRREGGDISLLVRMVDDYLYVTTSRDSATEFVEAMHAGFGDYGCFANVSKTKANFEASLRDGSRLGAVPASAHGPTFIAWCGFLVDTETLEFRNDYTRGEGLYARDALTVHLTSRPGQFLAERIKHTAQHKCHPLLFDGNINTPFTVALNLYQNFLFTAIKFYLTAKNLPQLNGKFLLDTIINTVNCTVSYVANALQGEDAKSQSCYCPVSSRHISFLGFHAFYSILKRKQTAFGPLLQVLKKRSRYNTLTLPIHLYRAIDPIQSPVFFGPDRVRW